MYHVFLNRYSHVINMVNFIFDKITPLSVNTKDIYNYNLVGKWKNSEILINCGNKKKYIFNVHIFFSDQSEIICSLKNPTELYASKITFIKKNTKKIKLFRKENVFYQVKNILNKNDISTYNDVIKI